MKRTFWSVLFLSWLVICALAGILVVGVLAGDYTDVSVVEAKIMIDQRPWFVILDVRNESEYDAGHIRNAVLIPVWQLASRLDELNKTDEILVYCKVGARSAAASLILADNGFSHVYHMLDGIDGWISLAYSVYVKYSSIQEVINNATHGEVINVSSGHYYEHLIINNPVTLQGENVSTTVIDGNGTGTVVEVAGENVAIVDFTVQGGGCGCGGYAAVYGGPWSSGLNLTGNLVTRNGYGIRLYGTSNVILSHNEISTNSYSAIQITFSNGNVIAQNEVTNSTTGLALYSSSINNTFDANHFETNNIGVYVEKSSDNFFYQNNFAQNEQHVKTDEVSNNTWDGGNVTGGNYWDNYSGEDSDHDGIGDSPQILGTGNQDNYPLMGLFSAFTTSTGYRFCVTSNSTIEDLQYDSSENTIRMRVVNMTENQQNGFCRLTIPSDIMPPPYEVTINDNPANYSTVFENSSICILYLNYQHSTVEILVVSEYASVVFLALVGGAMILSCTVRLKKRTRKHSAACATSIS